jgi:hypothetical protein
MDIMMIVKTLLALAALGAVILYGTRLASSVSAKVAL